jgi:hypothetical protein
MKIEDFSHEMLSQMFYIGLFRSELACNQRYWTQELIFYVRPESDTR